ncbi:hypothetical protein BDF20DRAFT_113096 [Mycotypha africana]|uniref:uncharacterized protein n=1 Tax=Mycotypha africana TaxID=64632 RepID=UPI002300C1F8|nr:uncharacterized protein BDF20DRAFT_113096 [Mycotypha africana]KAI8970236.1 hypothetical protein BDF20DRAFT_113096 [Mycotypha africana]
MYTPYSLEELTDPYRNRRASSTKEESSPTTPKSATQLLPPSPFQQEPGRAYSYLPYSNHALDLGKATSKKPTDLYVEDDIDNMTITSFHQVVNMLNGEEQQRALTLITDNNNKLLLLQQQQEIKKRGRKPRSIFLDRRCWVITTFCCLGIILSMATYFCWPRLPLFVITSEKLERIGEPADWGPKHQPWLKATWELNMTLNNSGNYVQTRVQNIEFILKDKNTHQPFAWSKSGVLQLPAHEKTKVSLLFNVDYEPNSVDDPTFKNLYNACGPQMPSEPPALNVTLEVIMHIYGISWATVININSTEVGGLYCPFN